MPQSRNVIDEAIEQRFLKGKTDQYLGVYCDAFSAKTSIDGQDGGVVTSLLAKGLEKGFFDAAIVVRRLEGYHAEAVTVDNARDALAAKGALYLKVNVTKKLLELIKNGKKSIAIVCTPCEAKAARHIQQVIKGNYQVTVLGLFCFEAFNHEKLKREVQNQLGIDIDRAQKTSVHHGKFLVQVDGKEVSCKVKDLDLASETACGYCSDFCAQFADVSVGSVGSKQGYSTVIVRSEAGEKLMEKANLVKEAVDKEQIVNLSKFKKERAQKAVDSLKNQGQ